MAPNECPQLHRDLARWIWVKSAVVKNQQTRSDHSKPERNSIFRWSFSIRDVQCAGLEPSRSDLRFRAVPSDRLLVSHHRAEVIWRRVDVNVFML